MFPDIPPAPDRWSLHGRWTYSHTHVVTNFKTFAGKYLQWCQSSVTFQAASCTLGKSGLCHACFHRNSRRIFQNGCFNYLDRPCFTSFWQHGLLPVFAFLHLCVSVYLSFNFNITFNFIYSRGVFRTPVMISF